MNSREISLWTDERWYRALTTHLNGETVETRLQTVLEEMCKELPREEYERISGEITEEDRLAREEYEANRKLAIFRIKENGTDTRFLVNERMELLSTAHLLRAYLKGDTPSDDGFAGRFYRREPLTEEQFQAFASERMENTGRVTGAYDIDLDKGIVSTLNIMDSWQSFTSKDISTAAYHAYRKAGLKEDERWQIFVDYLEDRVMTPDEYKAFDRIRAVVVEPGKVPQVKEIGADLEGLQSVVGGDIEAVYPYDDPVALICNDEGKYLGLTFNRALRDSDGDVYDIVAGTFAIVGIGEEDFISLSDELAQKYAQVFHTPEQFARFGERIVVIPCEEVEQPVQFLSGDRRLQPNDISFAEEIMQNDNLLEFYMEVDFNADEVFGTNVCTDENDDWMNIYANYDMEEQCVCDTLEVYLVQSYGPERGFKYTLSDEEKAMLLPKMEEYCQHRLHISLDECRQQYLEEQDCGQVPQTPLM